MLYMLQNHTPSPTDIQVTIYFCRNIIGKSSKIIICIVKIQISQNGYSDNNLDMKLSVCTVAYIMCGSGDVVM